MIKDIEREVEAELALEDRLMGQVDEEQLLEESPVSSLNNKSSRRYKNELTQSTAVDPAKQRWWQDEVKEIPRSGSELRMSSKISKHPSPSKTSKDLDKHNERKEDTPAFGLKPVLLSVGLDQSRHPDAKLPTLMHQKQDFTAAVAEESRVVPALFNSTHQSFASSPRRSINTHQPIKYSPEPWSKKREGMNITSASLNVQALIQSQAVRTDDPTLSNTIDAAEFRRKLRMYNEGAEDIITAGKSLEYDEEEDEMELDGLDEHEEDRKIEVQLDKLNKINTLYGQRFRYQDRLQDYVKKISEPASPQHRSSAYQSIDSFPKQSIQGSQIKFGEVELALRKEVSAKKRSNPPSPLERHKSNSPTQSPKFDRLKLRTHDEGHTVDDLVQLNLSESSRRLPGQTVTVSKRDDVDSIDTFIDPRPILKKENLFDKWKKQADPKDEGLTNIEKNRFYTDYKHKWDSEMHYVVQDFQNTIFPYTKHESGPVEHHYHALRVDPIGLKFQSFVDRFAKTKPSLSPKSK